MSVVTARNFQKNFGAVQERVLRGEHVRITHHGRPRMVVLSDIEYELLKNGGRVSRSAPDMPDEWVETLESTQLGDGLDSTRK